MMMMNEIISVPTMTITSLLKRRRRFFVSLLVFILLLIPFWLNLLNLNLGSYIIINNDIPIFEDTIEVTKKQKQNTATTIVTLNTTTFNNHTSTQQPKQQQQQENRSSNKTTTITTTTTLTAKEKEKKNDTNTTPEVEDNQSSSVASLLDQYVSQAAVAYEPWRNDNNYGWCILNDDDHDKAKTNNNNNKTENGLLFVKTHKTGSSTAAGVTMQIADQIGKKKFGNKQCKQKSMHEDSTRKHSHWKMDSPTKQNTSSFVWTIVRHPSPRVVSSFYFFQLGHEHISTYNDSKFVNYINSNKNYLFNFIRIVNPTTTAAAETDNGRQAYKLANDDNPQQLIQNYLKPQIFDAYNFIAVSERWDESVVMLKILLNLDFHNIVTLSTKGSGSWAWEWHKSSCFLIPKKNISNTIQKYLQTDFQKNNVDFILYEIANKSLDMTIDKYGQENNFQEQLHIFRELKKVAENLCLPKTVFPCNSDGTFNAVTPDGCYLRDFGCGHACVEEVVTSWLKNNTNGSVLD